MLTILGQQNQLCDGIPRRSFLKIGGLALGGMSLSQMLEAEARAGIRSSHKAIIMIVLPGGPDLSGRPHYLVDNREPIRELI